MPGKIVVNEAFIRQVADEFQQLRGQIPGKIGGDGGVPLNAVHLVAGAPTFTAGTALVSTATANAAKIYDAMITYAKKMDDYTQGVQHFLAETGEVESLNNASAADFLSYLGPS